MTSPVKEDRRSRRTRQLIGQALIELMLEKPYDSISVQDILERADVGRSTFYTHYTDKDNVLMTELARVMHGLQMLSQTADQTHPELFPSLAMLRHVREQRHLMQAFLWGRGAEFLIRSFRAEVDQIVAHNLRSMPLSPDTNTIPLKVLSRFVADTFLMLLQWWSEENMQHTPEQVNAMFQTLVMPAVQNYINIRRERT